MPPDKYLLLEERGSMGPWFLTFDSLTSKIDEPQRSIVVKIWKDNVRLFTRLASGSSHNHQAWPGGYWNHVTEGMNFAVELHAMMSRLRPLDFTLSEALVVMFLHDIEKPWKYSFDASGNMVDNPDISNKAARKAFRDAKLAEYGLELNPRQINAMLYVEGELDDYTNKERVQWPLAAFCHMCDTASARVWPNRPWPIAQEDDQPADSWPNAFRIYSLKFKLHPSQECPHCAALEGYVEVDSDLYCKHCGSFVENRSIT